MLNKNLKKYGFIVSVLIYPAVLFIIFYVVVNFYSIAMAFQKIDAKGNTSFYGLNNFKNFFVSLSGASIVKTSLLNSLKIYIISLVVCMPLYLIFSFYLFKKFFMHRLIRIVVMLPAIISGIIYCLIFKQFVEGALPNIMRALGVENFPNLLTNERYTFGTTLFYSIWISFSTSLIVYPNAMNGIGQEIIESSEIDGVNNFQQFFYIILPLIFPTISTFLIMGVAGIFTNSGSVLAFYMYEAYPETYNYGYYMLVKVVQSRNGLEYPLLTAGGIMLTIVVAPLTYLVKHLLEKYGPEANA